jgi:hypothetical protein
VYSAAVKPSGSNTRERVLLPSVLEKQIKLRQSYAIITNQ